MESQQIVGRMGGQESSGNFYSVGDLFENGASFKGASFSGSTLQYNDEQRFQVADASLVRSLTSSAGVLQCFRSSRC